MDAASRIVDRPDRLAGCRAAIGAEGRTRWAGERFKIAVTDLAAEAEARKAADIQLASLLSEQRARDAAHDAQIAQLKDAQAALTAQFREVGQVMLDGAQESERRPPDNR